MDFKRKYCPDCFSLLGEGDYDYVTGHTDYECGVCHWEGNERCAVSCEEKILTLMRDMLEETFTEEAMEKIIPIVKDEVFKYLEKKVDDDFVTGDVKPYLSRVIFKYISTSIFLNERKEMDDLSIISHDDI